MEGSGKGTASGLSALVGGHKSVATFGSSMQAESAQHRLEAGEAAAEARLEAGREEEAEVAAHAREEKRREAAQKSPADNARASIVKLSNVVAGKLRALQAAQVEVLHLPRSSPEEASVYELYKTQQASLGVECTKVKAELDSALALGSRATTKLLQETHSTIEKWLY